MSTPRSTSRPAIPSPERRTRGDLIATGFIAACLVVGGTGVWLSSDAHSVHHDAATGQPKEVSTSSRGRPRQLTQRWTAKTQGEDVVMDRGGDMVLVGS